MEALVKRSTLALKAETSALTGDADSSGTTVTGNATSFTTELVVGDFIGNFTNGWRRVVAIASDTSLTVDSAFTVALSTSSLSKQAYGVDPTVASADVVEFVAPFTFDPTRDQLERNTVKNTFEKQPKITGDESVGGEINLELHGSGTAGVAPESDPLWLSAMGERRASSASTTHGTNPCTTTSIELVAGGGANFKVGEAILIDPAGSDAYEVAFITAIATDTLTVSPALSTAPGTGVDVGAGVHYFNTLNEPFSFWAQYWRGDITKETYKGNKVAALAVDFNVGQLVQPKFTCEGKDTGDPASESYGLGTPTFDSASADPHVARYMAIRVGGTTYPVSSVAFNRANSLTRRKDCTSAGTKKMLRTESEVTGSFSLAYENADIETAFKNGTTAELVIVSSTGAAKLVAGNVYAVRMPLIKYTAIPKSEQDGVYQYDVSFETQPDANGKSIYCSFL